MSSAIKNQEKMVKYQNVKDVKKKGTENTTKSTGKKPENMAKIIVQGIKKKYCEEHKSEIKEKDATYYENNREEILRKNKIR